MQTFAVIVQFTSPMPICDATRSAVLYHQVGGVKRVDDSRIQSVGILNNRLSPIELLCWLNRMQLESESACDLAQDALWRRQSIERLSSKHRLTVT